MVRPFEEVDHPLEVARGGPQGARALQAGRARRAGRAVRGGHEVQGAHDRMDRYGLPRARPRHAPHASPAGGVHADMQGLGVGTAEDRGPAAPSSWAGGRCRVEDGACQAALLPDLGDRVVVREGREAGRNTGRPGPGDGSAEDLGDRVVAGLAARGAYCHQCGA